MPNFFTYRNQIRTGEDSHDIQAENQASDAKQPSAREVVTEQLALSDAIEQINGLSNSLFELRSRADAGDVQAMYDANMQIALLKAARERIARQGVKLYFNSSTHRYETSLTL